MLLKLRGILVGLLLVPVLGGCVSTGGGGYDALQAQVAQHEQVLQQLNSQLSGVQPAQADTWSQVQSMRQEVAALRGQLDNMNNSMAQSGGVGSVSETLARHDRALRLIETQLAMDLQLGQPVSYGAPVATTPYGTSGVAPMPVTPVPVTSAPGSQQGNLDTAQALYDQGMASFNNRRYEAGLKSFADFTQAYPNHSLVSNAWFWQGECHYQLKNYAAAALAYERVIADFPNSNKAPAAYLKQGLSFVNLGKKDAARERLNQLVQKYPRAPEAARAKQEMQTYKL